MTNLNPEKNQKAWVALAELFYLDIEPSQKDFDRTAKFLKEISWDRIITERVLVEWVAPVAAGNLRRGLLPVIAGEWTGFDQNDLCQKIIQKQALRHKKNSLFLWFQDKWHERFLNQMGMERLLCLLP